MISACGERDDRLFAPLARAIESSPFEPCQIAHQLVFVPRTDEVDHTVQDASAFFKRHASETNVESFYNALIDALWARHLRLRAKSVFLQAREVLENYPRPEYNEKMWCLDLRSLSKGASQVALFHWLEDVAERAEACPVVAPRLVLVTGGRKESTAALKPYSGKGRGAGVVRQTVEEVVKVLGIPFTQSSREFGPAQLQAETEQVVRWVSLYKDRLQLSNTAPS